MVVGKLLHVKQKEARGMTYVYVPNGSFFFQGRNYRELFYFTAPDNSPLCLSRWLYLGARGVFAMGKSIMTLSRSRCVWVECPPFGSAVERYHNKNRRGARGMIRPVFLYAFYCSIFGTTQKRNPKTSPAPWNPG